MAISIGSLTIENASRPRQKPEYGLAIHEIANASGGFVQTTGKLTDIFEYEVVLEDADRATLLALVDGNSHIFSDNVNGVSCNAIVQLANEVEEVPGLWRLGIKLVKVAF